MRFYKRASCRAGRRTTSPTSQEEAPKQQSAQASLNRHKQAHLSACRLVGEVPGNPIGRAAPRAWFLYFRNSSVRLRVAGPTWPAPRWASRSPA